MRRVVQLIDEKLIRAQTIGNEENESFRSSSSGGAMRRHSMVQRRSKINVEDRVEQDQMAEKEEQNEPRRVHAEICNEGAIIISVFFYSERRSIEKHTRAHCQTENSEF